MRKKIKEAIEENKDKNKTDNKNKKYHHESRHRHAMNRERGKGYGYYNKELQDMIIKNNIACEKELEENKESKRKIITRFYKAYKRRIQ